MRHAYDPTIPRKGRTTASKSKGRPTIGWLVRNTPDNVVLTDRDGNTWSQDRFRMLQGWGGGSSGIERAPRPFEYDPATSEPIIVGDMGLILFLQDNPSMPIFLPGARNTNTASDLLSGRPHQADPNALKIRHAVRNAAGLETARFDIEVDASGDWADVRIGGPIGSPLRIRLNLASGQVQIDQGGLRQALVTEDLLARLSGSLAELSGKVAGLAGPNPTTDALVADLSVPTNFRTSRLTSE